MNSEQDQVIIFFANRETTFKKGCVAKGFNCNGSKIKNIICHHMQSSYTGNITIEYEGEAENDVYVNVPYLITKYSPKIYNHTDLPKPK